LNRGSAGTRIIVLALIILIAAVPWYFIISRNISTMLSDTPEAGVASPAADHPRPEDEVPVPPPPTPSPSPTPEPVQDTVPLGENIFDIKTLDPELFDELNEAISEYNAVAVGLVLYDGEAGEYFTYEFGYADAEDKRFADASTKFRVLRWRN